MNGTTDLVRLENDDVAVVVEPHRGGRVLALRDRRRGVDWLVPTPSDAATTESPSDPGLWASHPRGGWDECLPSIQQTRLPEHGLPAVGDHGDLWSSPWHEVDPPAPTSGPASWLGVDVADGYTFLRGVELDGAVLRLTYVLLSRVGRDLPFLWSMHPLLPERAGLRRTFAEGTPMLVEYSSAPSVRRGTTVEWGRPVPGVADWVLGSVPAAPVAVKGFVAAPPTFSAVQDGSALTFRVDPAVVPHVGVWLNHGAWPSPGAPDRHVALEPATAATDDLALALDREQARVLTAYGRVSWDLEILVEEAS